MSELKNPANNVGSGQWRLCLLNTVSAISLLGVSSFATAAVASDSSDGAPTVWIEVGTQLERIVQQPAPYLPPFTPALLSNGGASPALVQRLPNYSYGFDGSVAFAPTGSLWTFSAAVRYGRSNNARHTHDQAEEILHAPVVGLEPQTASAGVTLFSDGNAHSHESHTVLDFSAGKDVGLGIFGSGSSSTFNVGVRYAQFGSRSNATFLARPNPKLNATGYTFVYHYYFTPTKTFSYPKIRRNVSQGIYTAAGYMARSFHGLGPSLSWNASVPLVGSDKDAEFTFDWGANAALLFGRQKVVGHHQTTIVAKGPNYESLGPPGLNGTRSHSVIVPNLGGFAGMSLKFPNANVSLGYRADFFFDAMDTGSNSQSKSTIGFHGPFASISIGLGG